MVLELQTFNMKGIITCRSCCSVLLACCCTPCCAVRCATPVLSAERLTDLDASARIHGGSSRIAASSAAADTVCCPAGAGQKGLHDIPRLQLLGPFDIVCRIKVSTASLSLRPCSASKHMTLQQSHITEDYVSGKWGTASGIPAYGKFVRPPRDPAANAEDLQQPEGSPT